MCTWKRLHLLLGRTDSCGKQRGAEALLSVPSDFAALHPHRAEAENKIPGRTAGPTAPPPPSVLPPNTSHLHKHSLLFNLDQIRNSITTVQGLHTHTHTHPRPSYYACASFPLSSLHLPLLQPYLHPPPPPPPVSPSI